MNPEYMGIFGFSLHEKIADYIGKSVDVVALGYTKAKLVNVSQALLPIYQNAVARLDIPAYQAGSPDRDQILNYCVERSGLPAGIVTLWLMALQEMAQKGLIDFKHWRPEIQEKAVTTGIEPLKQDLKDILPGAAQALEPVAKFLGSQLNKLLITSAVVLTIFLISKEVMRYGRTT